MYRDLASSSHGFLQIRVSSFDLARWVVVVGYALETIKPRSSGRWDIGYSAPCWSCRSFLGTCRIRSEGSQPACSASAKVVGRLLAQSVLQKIAVQRQGDPLHFYRSILRPLPVEVQG